MSIVVELSIARLAHGSADMDAIDGNPPHGWIHQGTTLLICGIIAGNIWDG